MEDFFELPPAEPEEIEPKTNAEYIHEAREIYNALSTVEKIDISLPVVKDLTEHNNEMDDISQRAIKSFEDLMQLGSNVPDLHAGKIFEVAGVMLKTAMEAKNAKAEKKLRMIELQIKKARLEQLGNAEHGDGTSNNLEFDRNELLKYMIDSKNSDTSENSDK